jgi:hypothetical protein
MAIILPSKNTFKIENSIVINNELTSMEVNTKKPRTIRQYGAEVFSINGIDTTDVDVIPTLQDIWHMEGFSVAKNILVYSSLNNYYMLGSFCGVMPMYKTIKLEIPKRTNSAMITAIFNGLDKNSNPNIQTTVKYKYVESDVGDVRISAKESTIVDLVVYLYTNQIETSSSNYINNDMEVSVSSVLATSGASNDYSSYKSITNKQNINSAIITYDATKEQYVVQFTMLCGLTTFKGAVAHNIQEKGDGVYEGGGIHLGTSLPNNPIRFRTGMDDDKLKFKATYHRPIGLDVSLFGNKISFEIGDEVIRVGDDDTNIITVNASEFMQPYNYIQGENETRIPSITTDFSKTVSQYKNGKQIVTLKCSVGDYYDSNGTKAIPKEGTTRKMSFDIYDEVVPMVRNQYGKDTPLALLPNGDAKTFRVLGVKYSYDGAVWQELTLQESGSVHLQFTRDYTIRYSGEPYPIDETYIFNIKGSGKIYINDILLDTVNHPERKQWQKA